MQSRQSLLTASSRKARLRALIKRSVALTVAVSAAILIAFVVLRELVVQDAAADRERLMAARLLQRVLDEETGVRGYALTGQNAYLEPYREGQRDVASSVTDLSRDFSAGTPGAQALTRFASLHTQWETEVAAPILASPVAGNSVVLEARDKALVDEMRTNIAAIDALAATNRAVLARRSVEIQYAAALIIVAAVIIMGLVSLFNEDRALIATEEGYNALLEMRDSATRLGEWRMKVIAMLAHDFKSTLSVIAGCASVLEEFPERRDDARTYHAIHEAVSELAEMTDEALLAARIASNAMLVKLNRVRLSTVLDSVAARYREHREIALTCADEYVLADERYLLRAFDNLVSNATKYSLPPEPVDIVVRREGQFIEICVSDRGQGIEPADLPHIFEEYWRSVNAGTASGAGIGLYIVKKIIDAHGGDIDIISAPGAGTTVYVRLRAA